jgi:hypothetical protein
VDPDLDLRARARPARLRPSQWPALAVISARGVVGARFYALVNVVGSILAGLGAAYCGLLLAQFFS